MQSESLREYSALADSGLLEQLQDYQAKAHNYEELISQSLELFTKSSEEALVEYLSSCLIQRFIPSYLVVFLRVDGNSDTVNNICYQNLRPARCPVQLQSLEPYRSFFEYHPNIAEFATLQREIPKHAEQIRPLNPDLVIPLHGLNGLYGFVVLGRKVLGEDYTPDERTYIEMLFEYASIGLQNVIHYTSSVTDFKTKLYNHAFFLRRLQEEMNRVDRHHSSFALLALDIDNFKSLNDRYGHLAGDRVLFHLSRVIEESVRQEDIVSRYGGEEFLVLLTQCSKSAAFSVAERMRQSIAESTIYYQDLQLSITVSIGLTHCVYPPDSDYKQIIAEADRALYKAKNHGRNRCEMYNAGLLVAANRLSSINHFT
ncbi:MAG: GGDEF domain-containing protein [Spirochaeta sp.]